MALLGLATWIEPGLKVCRAINDSLAGISGRYPGKGQGEDVGAEYKKVVQGIEIIILLCRSGYEGSPTPDVARQTLINRRNTTQEERNGEETAHGLF